MEELKINPNEVPCGKYDRMIARIPQSSFLDDLIRQYVFATGYEHAAPELAY